MLIHARAWVNLESTVLSERAQSQRLQILRDHIYEVSRMRKSTETESRVVVG